MSELVIKQIDSTSTNNPNSEFRRTSFKKGNTPNMFGKSATRSDRKGIDSRNNDILNRSSRSEMLSNRSKATNKNGSEVEYNKFNILCNQVIRFNHTNSEEARAINTIDVFNKF